MEEFLQASKIDSTEAVLGAELQKLFWKFKGYEMEIERQKQFWASTNSTLEDACLQLEERTKELSAARRSIQNILDNLGQGFMTFESSGLIRGSVSQAAKEFFGQELVDQPFLTVLGIHGDSLPPMQQWLGMLFQEAIPFQSLKAIGPQEYRSADGRFIELDYRPIRDPDSKIERVIVISTDRTRERELQKKTEQANAKVEMLIRVLRDKKSFVFFVGETRKMLDELEKEVDPADAFRSMHSIKGGAGNYRMLAVQERAHQLEELVPQLPAQAQEFLEGVKLLKTDFEDLVSQCERVIGKLDQGGVGEKTLEMSAIYEVARLLKSAIPQESVSFREFHDRFVLAPLQPQLKRFEFVVAEAAQNLGKDVELEIVSSSIRVLLEPYVSLLNSLVHAFRNAVDHGIELPQEREKSGKPKSGRIQCRCEPLASENGKRLLLTIQDDGRGIDPDRIRSLAIQRELIGEAAAQALAAEEAIQLVFAPGFSTKSEVTELSGRGVGLDAIQVAATSLGGRAWVESALGRGTSLKIDLPWLDEIP